MIGSYARISTEDQSKYSISSQLKENKTKASSLYPDIPVLEYIDNGHSGEYLERPSLNKLRNDIKSGLITVVICYDPDRLSRKLMNQLIITEEFQKRGVELIFVSGDYAKTPEGALYYNMRGVFSEYEKAKINERMSRGRRGKAEKGKIVRDYQVYGYNYDQETCQFVINEDEASIVRLIFDLVVSPDTFVEGINGIAKYLTEKGVPTKRGAKVWHRQVVRQILMNPTYTGTFMQNKWNSEGMLGNKHKSKDDKIPMELRPEEEWIPVPCPVIIEQAQFDRAQAYLAEGKRRWAKNGTRDYLLSGLVRCGHCGNTMTGRRTKNWGKHVYEYTDVKNYAGAKNPGCGMRIMTKTAEREVWDTIVNWLNNPDEIAAAKEDVNEQSFEEMERQRIESEIERCKTGRKRLINLLAESEDIGETEIREKLREVKKREEELTKELQEIINRLSTAKKNNYSEKAIQEAAEYYLNINPNEISFEDKQNLIRHVVREVMIYKDHIEIIQF